MLKIDSADATPPFEQLREQLIARIRTGELSPGTKLASVRALADQLGLAPNTVARTYRELEATGFVKTRGRNGTIVAPKLDDPETHVRALALTGEYVAAMAALGIDEVSTLEYVRQDQRGRS